MKIRSGFVSNSSTSSFVVLGVAVETRRMEELHGDAMYDMPGVLVDDETTYIGVIERLDEFFPEAKIAIDFSKVEEAMTAVYLACNRRDIKVYVVTLQS